MNWIKKTWNQIPSSPKTVREFGFILAGFLLFFPALASGIKFFLARQSFHYWFGWPILSFTALVINGLVPAGMSLVYRAAMFVAHGISWVMMRLILGFFFYLVLSPISITIRILGKDILDQKIDPNARSYWKKREHRSERERYERLF
ncbi:MAG: hypothetical protein HY583_03175 [Candidatus Omnitrophica bacterium]|nr:hypothetical protein [Candidatus Omnitrophota bacterium]